MTLAGRVVARLESRATRRRCSCTSSSSTCTRTAAPTRCCSASRSSNDPGSGAPVEVYLGHTGYRVPTGHRLRLHVASSDFPVFLPHPGTGENPWDATATRTNRQTLATGGTSPSYVSLTVLPDGR